MKPLPIRTRLKIVLGAVALLALALALGRPFVASRGLQASFDAEFFARPDGYPGLVETYGLEFGKPPMQMDPGLKYRALAEGLVDVIDAYATDGRIEAYGLTVLEDDRNFFPPYHAAPLVNGAALERHPGLRETLNRLGGRIDDALMQQMNYRADVKGEKASDIAREFLIEEGLIEPGAKPDAPGAGTVVIGGKPFTEQEILGEIMAQLIEAKLGLRVERKFNLGGTLICFNAVKSGAIDVYPEYTGTALMSILDRDVVTDADRAYRIVKREFEKRWNLAWLDPFGLNNAYTLTMREQHARALGIVTISDLAAYVSAKPEEAPKD